MSKRLPIGLFDATIHHVIEIPQLDSILGAIGSPSEEWKKSIEDILMSVKVDLNKLRRGLDKFHANEEERKRLIAEKNEYLASEEIEDAEAAVYVAQSEEYKAASEAEKASLRARIAELEAQGDGLSEADRERLNGMIEELAQAVSLEEETPETPEAPAEETPSPASSPAPSPLG